jgi:hypothetical protein
MPTAGRNPFGKKAASKRGPTTAKKSTTNSKGGKGQQGAAKAVAKTGRMKAAKRSY